jgi:TPR repeat protein
MNLPDPMLKERAEKGDAEAQYQLGNVYYFGKGVAVDHDKANEWYQKAADNDHRYAERALPFGETLSRKMARWSKKSPVNMVVLYIIIFGALAVAVITPTPASRARAAKEMAIKNEEMSKTNARVPQQYMSHHTSDTAFLLLSQPTLKLFEKSYEGNAESQFELCLEYMKGAELGKDPVKAFAWLKLTRIYKGGRPLPAEFTKAEIEIKAQLTPSNEKAASTLAFEIYNEIEAKIAAKQAGK